MTLQQIRRLIVLTWAPVFAGCSAPLTHTALDLTPFGAILSAVGVLYWTITAAALCLAAVGPKTARDRAVALIVVIALFGYLPVTAGWEIHKAHTRLAKAEAMFAERCKTAGEKIHRTAENVEGVFLMKLRSKPNAKDPYDQFGADDPYGHDVGGDGYIMGFLMGRTSDGSLAETNAVTNGYAYVEAVDTKGRQRYRYTAKVKVVGQKDGNAPNIQRARSRNPNLDLNIYAYVLDKAPVATPPLRYGLTYDDISTREEREYWIAGSSIQIIDLQTKQVMAERIGYMMDKGQGSMDGGRSPWEHAARNACPAFPSSEGVHPFKMDQTRDFVEKVLHIKQEK